jgi:hypothetical protein
MPVFLVCLTVQVNSTKAATRSLKALCSTKGGVEACDLLSRLLTYDPQARLDVAPKLLNHPYFKASILVDEERDKVRRAPRTVVQIGIGVGSQSQPRPLDYFEGPRL